MSDGLAIQAVVAGAAVGGAYALVAMGFTLAWRLTRTFALAHGDLAVSAVLLAVAAIVGQTPVAVAPGAVRSAGLVLLALGIGAGLGVVIYLAVIRPATNGPGEDTLTWSAGLLVVALALRAAVAAVFPGSGISVPDPLHLSLGGARPLSLPGGGDVAVRSIAVIVVAVLAAVTFDRVLATSRWGRRVNAVADNAGLARLCGIAADRTIAIAFAVAGLSAALAGLLAAPGQAVTPTSGVQLGLAGAAAAVIGRLGSLRSAAVAGLMLGIAQQLLLLGSGPVVPISDLLPAGLLVAVALLRPAGLLPPIRPRPGKARATSP